MVSQFTTKYKQGQLHMSLQVCVIGVRHFPLVGRAPHTQLRGRFTRATVTYRTVKVSCIITSNVVLDLTCTLLKGLSYKQVLLLFQQIIGYRL